MANIKLQQQKTAYLCPKNPTLVPEAPSRALYWRFDSGFSTFTVGFHLKHKIVLKGIPISYNAFFPPILWRVETSLGMQCFH